MPLFDGSAQAFSGTKGFAESFSADRTLLRLNKFAKVERTLIFYFSIGLMHGQLLLRREHFVALQAVVTDECAAERVRAKTDHEI